MLNQSSLNSVKLSAGRLENLRRKAQIQPEVSSFENDISFFSLLAAIGIQREVGTRNDELARFIFDTQTGELVPRERIKAELVEYKGKIGVRIWADFYPKIELRFYGIQTLVHPSLSFNQDGSLAQLVIFPEVVAKIARLEGVDVAFVRPWALNTVFELHPSDDYYLTNIWELKRLDVLRFAQLTQSGQVPFLGTHDLVAHIAGSKANAWPSLKAKALEVNETIFDYLGDTKSAWLGALVLPYVAGILLDDLAQPPVYNAITRTFPLDLVLQSIRSKKINPHLSAKLLRYPAHHEKIIRLARFGAQDEVIANAALYLRAIEGEILGSSVTDKESLCQS